MRILYILSITIFSLARIHAEKHTKNNTNIHYRRTEKHNPYYNGNEFSKTTRLHRYTEVTSAKRAGEFPLADKPTPIPLPRLIHSGAYGKRRKSNEKKKSTPYRTSQRQTENVEHSFQHSVLHRKDNGTIKSVNQTFINQSNNTLTEGYHLFEFFKNKITSLGIDAILLPKLFTEDHAEKKAITPRRKSPKSPKKRFRHHDGSRRPPFPVKNIAPDVIERELEASGSGGGPGDPPIPPAPPPPPPPPIIVPPAAPAAPVVINTAPGPGAGTVKIVNPGGGGGGGSGPESGGPAPGDMSGAGGTGPEAGGPDSGGGKLGVGDGSMSGGGDGGGGARGKGGGSGGGGRAGGGSDGSADPGAKAAAASAAADEKLKALENTVQALANKIDNQATAADESPQSAPPEGALNDMIEKISDKVTALGKVGTQISAGGDWVGTINGMGPNEQQRPNAMATNFGSGPELSGSAQAGGRPTQVASGLLDGQLLKLQEIMMMLGQKVDDVSQRVDKKPTELERASLLAGMTSTFGGLQNTIETLSGKIEDGLRYKPPPPREQADKDAAATAYLATKIGKLDGSMLTLGDKIKLLNTANQDSLERAMQAGINSERLKSNARLEESMKLLADGMTRLGQKMSKPAPTPPPPLPVAPIVVAPPAPVSAPAPAPAPPPPDSKLTAQQTEVMNAQANLAGQMATIQKGLGVLSDGLAKLKEKPPVPPPPPPAAKAPPWMVLAKQVLKNTADSFSDIAEASSKSAKQFSSSIDKSVDNARKLLTSEALKSAKKLSASPAAAVAAASKAAGLSPFSSIAPFASMMPLVAPFGSLGTGAGLGEGLGAGLGTGIGVASIAPMAASIAQMPVAPDPGIGFPDLAAGLGMLSKLTGGGGAVAAPPVNSGNPLNFGTQGNGTPQLGVVTGNLGGSLGLGGTGGVDGGNALIMNQTIGKKHLVCRGTHPLCFWNGIRRSHVEKENKTWKWKRIKGRSRVRQRRNTENEGVSSGDQLNENIIGSAKSYVIRPISTTKLLANKLNILSRGATGSSITSNSVPLASLLSSLTSSPRSSQINQGSAASFRSDNPKQPGPGANMAAAIGNLLTQRLNTEQKYGPQQAAATAGARAAASTPSVDPASIASGVASGIASGTQAMFQNFGEQLNLKLADAVAQGQSTGNVMSAPKDGSFGTGTGGYTSSLGRFSDHLGYGNGLFGQGAGGAVKGSGMITPEAAAGNIAGMSTAAAEASAATSNTARMIQDNLWGRGGGGGGGAENNQHLQEWQKFFGVLPHHSEKGLTMADEHHGEDHNKHYFDHGEHGTGEDKHHHVYGHHTEYGHHDEWGFGDTGQYGHHHKWEEGPNGVFEHFGDWGKEHDHEGNHHEHEHHDDHHDGHHHEEHHEGEGHHGDDDGHHHDHEHQQHDHGHYHYIEVEHGHHDGGDHDHHGMFGRHGHYGDGGGYGGGMDGYGGGGMGGSYGGGYGYGDDGLMRRDGEYTGHEIHHIMHDTGDIQGDIGGTYNGGYAGGDGGTGYSVGGSHHGGHEDDIGHHGYHHNGEYGRLHLPVQSLLDEGGLGHNLRPLHALNELHGGRHHRFHGDHGHEQGHALDFLSHGLSHHGHHHLGRIHHKYHPEGIGHHYEYHQNHDDDYNHGNHHNLHHDDHMEDEHDTDHSHHIGWIHHDDDDSEEHHHGGEDYGSHDHDGHGYYGGGHHGEDNVHDHYDDEMEHHDGDQYGDNDVHDHYDDEMVHHEGESHHNMPPVDSTVAGVDTLTLNENAGAVDTNAKDMTESKDFAKALNEKLSCKRSNVGYTDCHENLQPIEINLKPRDSPIRQNDVNEIESIIDGKPFHKEYNENQNEGGHNRRTHEEIDFGNDVENGDKVNDDNEEGEGEENGHRDDRDDEEIAGGSISSDNISKQPIEESRRDPKDRTNYVTDAHFIDNLLPHDYKEAEHTRILEKLNSETKALANLYQNAEYDGDNNKGQEEKFMEKASRLTGTPWGLDKRGQKRSGLRLSNIQPLTSSFETNQNIDTSTSSVIPSDKMPVKYARNVTQLGSKRGDMTEDDVLPNEYIQNEHMQMDAELSKQSNALQAIFKSAASREKPDIHLEEKFLAKAMQLTQTNWGLARRDMGMMKGTYKAAPEYKQGIPSSDKNITINSNQSYRRNLSAVETDVQIFRESRNLKSPTRNNAPVLGNGRDIAKEDVVHPNTYMQTEYEQIGVRLSQQSDTQQQKFNIISNTNRPGIYLEEEFLDKPTQFTKTNWGLDRRDIDANKLQPTTIAEYKRGAFHNNQHGNSISNGKHRVNNKTIITENNRMDSKYFYVTDNTSQPRSKRYIARKDDVLPNTYIQNEHEQMNERLLQQDDVLQGIFKDVSDTNRSDIHLEENYLEKAMQLTQTNRGLSRRNMDVEKRSGATTNGYKRKIMHINQSRSSVLNQKHRMNESTALTGNNLWYRKSRNVTDEISQNGSKRDITREDDVLPNAYIQNEHKQMDARLSQQNDALQGIFKETSATNKPDIHLEERFLEKAMQLTRTNWGLSGRNMDVNKRPGTTTNGYKRKIMNINQNRSSVLNKNHRMNESTALTGNNLWHWTNRNVSDETPQNGSKRDITREDDVLPNAYIQNEHEQMDARLSKQNDALQSVFKETPDTNGPDIHLEERYLEKAMQLTQTNWGLTKRVMHTKSRWDVGNKVSRKSKARTRSGLNKSVVGYRKGVIKTHEANNKLTKVQCKHKNSLSAVTTKSSSFNVKLAGNNLPEARIKRKNANNDNALPNEYMRKEHEHMDAKLYDENNAFLNLFGQVSSSERTDLKLEDMLLEKPVQLTQRGISKRNKITKRELNKSTGGYKRGIIHTQLIQTKPDTEINKVVHVTVNAVNETTKNPKHGVDTTAKVAKSNATAYSTLLVNTTYKKDTLQEAKWLFNKYKPDEESNEKELQEIKQYADQSSSVYNSVPDGTFNERAGNEINYQQGDAHYLKEHPQEESHHRTADANMIDKMLPSNYMRKEHKMMVKKMNREASALHHLFDKISNSDRQKAEDIFTEKASLLTDTMWGLNRRHHRHRNKRKKFFVQKRNEASFLNNTADLNNSAKRFNIGELEWLLQKSSPREHHSNNKKGRKASSDGLLYADNDPSEIHYDNDLQEDNSDPIHYHDMEHDAEYERKADGAQSHGHKLFDNHKTFHNNSPDLEETDHHPSTEWNTYVNHQPQKVHFREHESMHENDGKGHDEGEHNDVQEDEENHHHFSHEKSSDEGKDQDKNDHYDDDYEDKEELSRDSKQDERNNEREHGNPIKENGFMIDHEQYSKNHNDDEHTGYERESDNEHEHDESRKVKAHEQLITADETFKDDNNKGNAHHTEDKEYSDHSSPTVEDGRKGKEYKERNNDNLDRHMDDKDNTENDQSEYKQESSEFEKWPQNSDKDGESSHAEKTYYNRYSGDGAESKGNLYKQREHENSELLGRETFVNEKHKQEDTERYHENDEEKYEHHDDHDDKKEKKENIHDAHIQFRLKKKNRKRYPVQLPEARVKRENRNDDNALPDEYIQKEHEHMDAKISDENNALLNLFGQVSSSEKTDLNLEEKFLEKAVQLTQTAWGISKRSKISQSELNKSASGYKRRVTYEKLSNNKPDTEINKVVHITGNAVNNTTRNPKHGVDTIAKVIKSNTSAYSILLANATYRNDTLKEATWLFNKYKPDDESRENEVQEIKQYGDQSSSAYNTVPAGNLNEKAGNEINYEIGDEHYLKEHPQEESHRRTAGANMIDKMLPRNYLRKEHKTMVKKLNHETSELHHLFDKISDSDSQKTEDIFTEKASHLTDTVWGLNRRHHWNRNNRKNVFLQKEHVASLQNNTNGLKNTAKRLNIGELEWLLQKPTRGEHHSNNKEDIKVSNGLQYVDNHLSAIHHDHDSHEDDSDQIHTAEYEPNDDRSKSHENKPVHNHDAFHNNSADVEETDQNDYNPSTDWNTYLKNQPQKIHFREHESMRDYDGKRHDERDHNDVQRGEKSQHHFSHRKLSDEGKDQEQTDHYDDEEEYNHGRKEVERNNNQERGNRIKENSPTHDREQYPKNHNGDGDADDEVERDKENGNDYHGRTHVHDESKEINPYERLTSTDEKYKDGNNTDNIHHTEDKEYNGHASNTLENDHKGKEYKESIDHKEDDKLDKNMDDKGNTENKSENKQESSNYERNHQNREINGESSNAEEAHQNSYGGEGDGSNSSFYKQRECDNLEQPKEEKSLPNEEHKEEDIERHHENDKEVYEHHDDHDDKKEEEENIHVSHVPFGLKKRNHKRHSVRLLQRRRRDANLDEDGMETENSIPAVEFLLKRQRELAEPMEVIDSTQQLAARKERSEDIVNSQTEEMISQKDEYRNKLIDANELLLGTESDKSIMDFTSANDLEHQELKRKIRTKATVPMFDSYIDNDDTVFVGEDQRQQQFPSTKRFRDSSNDNLYYESPMGYKSHNHVSDERYPHHSYGEEDAMSRKIHNKNTHKGHGMENDFEHDYENHHDHENNHYRESKHENEKEGHGKEGQNQNHKNEFKHVQSVRTDNENHNENQHEHTGEEHKHRNSFSNKHEHKTKHKHAIEDEHENEKNMHHKLKTYRHESSEHQDEEAEDRHRHHQTHADYHKHEEKQEHHRQHEHLHHSHHKHHDDTQNEHYIENDMSEGYDGNEIDKEEESRHENRHRHRTHGNHKHYDTENESDHHDENDFEDENEDNEHHMGEDIHGWSGYSKDHLKLMNPNFIDSLIPVELKELEEERLRHKVNKETKELMHLFDDITEHKVREPEQRFIGEASHLIGTKWGLNGDLGYKVPYPHIPRNGHAFHHVIVNLNDHGVSDYDLRDYLQYEHDHLRYGHDREYGGHSNINEIGGKRSAIRYHTKTHPLFTSVDTDTINVFSNKVRTLETDQIKMERNKLSKSKQIKNNSPNNFQRVIFKPQKISSTMSPDRKNLVFHNCGLQGQYKEGGEFDISIDDMKFKENCNGEQMFPNDDQEKGVHAEELPLSDKNEDKSVNNDFPESAFFETPHKSTEGLLNNNNDKINSQNTRFTIKEKFDPERDRNDNYFSNSNHDTDYLDTFDNNKPGARKDKTTHEDKNDNNESLQWDHDELANDEHNAKSHGEHIDDDHEGQHKGGKEVDGDHVFEDNDHEKEHDNHPSDGEHHGNRESNDHVDDESDDIDDHNMITGHYHQHHVPEHQHSHGSIDDQFHHFMKTSRYSQNVPSIGFTLHHLHGPNIGFSKNQNTGHGYEGNHGLGHDYLEGGHHDTHEGSHGIYSVGGHHGEIGGDLPLGFYGPMDNNGRHSSVTNEGHLSPIFLYGGQGGFQEGNHDVDEYGHLDNMHGVFHHGMQDGVPIDDHPAHYLFRHFAHDGTFGDEQYEHSLDDHLHHHALHGGLHDDHHGHHNHHDHHDFIDHRLVNPLDYAIPKFPQRTNSMAINHFFERETQRIAQHVNEFPLISDKLSVHPSVFRDQMNVLPSESDFNSFGIHHMTGGGRYAAGGTLIGAGTVGYGAVGRPSVGIGIAAGGSAGAGTLMGGKTPPLNALLQKASTKNISPARAPATGILPVLSPDPHLAEGTEAEPVVNAGFPQFHIPVAASLPFVPEFRKPIPLPFGPNPYQILSSEGFGNRIDHIPLDLIPSLPIPSKGPSPYENFTSNPIKQDKRLPDSPPSIGKDPKYDPPKPDKKLPDSPPSIGKDPKYDSPKPEPPPKPDPKPPPPTKGKPNPFEVVTTDTKKPARKHLSDDINIMRDIPKISLPKLLQAFSEMNR